MEGEQWEQTFGTRAGDEGLKGGEGSGIQREDTSCTGTNFSLSVLQSQKAKQVEHQWPEFAL